MAANNLILYRFSSANGRKINVLKAAEDFNNQFKIKRWIIHYDVRLTRNDILINFSSLR